MAAEAYGKSEMIDGRYTATLREVPIIELLPVTDVRWWAAFYKRDPWITHPLPKGVPQGFGPLCQDICQLLLRGYPAQQSALLPQGGNADLHALLSEGSAELMDGIPKAPSVDPNGANAAWPVNRQLKQ